MKNNNNKIVSVYAYTCPYEGTPSEARIGHCIPLELSYKGARNNTQVLYTSSESLKHLATSAVPSQPTFKKKKMELER